MCENINRTLTRHFYGGYEIFESQLKDHFVPLFVSDNSFLWFCLNFIDLTRN